MIAIEQAGMIVGKDRMRKIEIYRCYTSHGRVLSLSV